MLTNKLYTFRSYFRSSTKHYLDVLHRIESTKDRYTTALRNMCEACQYNIGPNDPSDDEWLRNLLPVAIEELDHLLLAPTDRLHEDFLDYHENADRFRIVIFGKVNSGKSYLANLIAGRDVKGLKQEGLSFNAVLSDGSQIKLDEFEVRPTETTKEIQWCDVETLRIVDLPGVGSISARNHELAVAYVKKADLVLFLSNSDAVLRGSEFRNIKEDLYGERKRILFIVTQCDMVKDIDTDERVPLKKRDIAEMVKYVETTLRTPKYGVADLMKSLDVVPVSARLARDGLELEHRGDRKRGVDKQKESNVHLLIDRILHIIADEGKELRILNPLNHTENVLEESVAALHTLRSIIERVQIVSRSMAHRLHQFHTAVSSHAEAERNALDSFIQHRRLKIDISLREIFSDKGIHHTLRDQQSAAETITMKFEEEIREELRARLQNAFQRWKTDLGQEYQRFIEESKSSLEHFRNSEEDDEQRKKIERDFHDMLTNLITGRFLKQAARRCDSLLEAFRPESLVSSVDVVYAQPVSQLIINGLLSSFGVKFHKKKEKVKKSIRTTLMNGLTATEKKALDIYDTQTGILNDTLQKTIRQLLVDRLRQITQNLSNITNETLIIGRKVLEELENIRKEEIR